MTDSMDNKQQEKPGELDKTQPEPEPPKELDEAPKSSSAPKHEPEASKDSSLGKPEKIVLDSAMYDLLMHLKEVVDDKVKIGFEKMRKEKENGEEDSEEKKEDVERQNSIALIMPAHSIKIESSFESLSSVYDIFTKVYEQATKSQAISSHTGIG